MEADLQLIIKAKTPLLEKTFYIGLAFKALNALIEFISGFVMVILNHDWLDRMIKLIALPELREDPNDIIMNFLISLGQNFTINSVRSVAIFLLLHGIIKLSVVWLLWKKKLWAYPPAAIIFGLFIAYEIYIFTHSVSVPLLLLIIIDTVLVVMIILEYRILKVSCDK